MPIWLVIILVLVTSIISFLFGRVSVKTDGLLIVDDADDKDIQWILDLHMDPMIIQNKKMVSLKVKKITENGDV